MAIGDIGAVIETLNYTAFSLQPDIIKGAAGNLFIMSQAQGARVRTLTIDDDGTNISAQIDTLEFEGGATGGGNVLHISGDVYAFCYRGVANNWIRTVTIDVAGNVGGAAIASFNLGASSAVVTYRPFIAHLYGNIYVASWTDNVNDGWISTVQINDDGTFGGGAIDTWEWAPDWGTRPFVLNTGRRFGGNLVVANVASEVTGTLRGNLRIAPITNAGLIGASWERLYDPLSSQLQTILHVSGNVYAVFYSRNTNTGWVQTLSFDGSAAPVLIDSWEWDAVFTQVPKAMTIGMNDAGDAMVFAIIGIGSAASPNQLKTVAIELDGTIRAALVDSLPIDADSATCTAWGICRVDQGIYAVVYYRGATGRTYIATVDIETQRAPTAQTAPATEVT